MVLVAHEGGTNEVDNESEPQVERLNGRRDSRYAAEGADNSMEKKISVKPNGKNKREEPTLKEIHYGAKANGGDIEAANRGRKASMERSQDSADALEDDEELDEAALAENGLAGSRTSARKVQLDEAQKSKQVIMDQISK